MLYITFFRTHRYFYPSFLFVFIIFYLFFCFIKLYAKQGIVKGSYVNIREQPNFTSKIIAKKARGEIYNILFEENGWRKVKFNDGVEGWIFLSLIESTLPEPSKIEASATNIISVIGISSPTSNFNISIPSSKSLAKDKKIENKQQQTNKQQAKKETKGSASNVPATFSINNAELVSKVASKPLELPNLPFNSFSQANNLIQSSKDNKIQDSQLSKNKNVSEMDMNLDNLKNVKQKNEQSTKYQNDIKKENLKYKIKEKEDNCSSSITISTKSAQDLYNEAIEYYEKKRYNDAINSNLEALKLAPNNPNILNNLASCYFKINQIQTAIDYWKKALEINPKSAKICNNLGIAYYQIDEIDKAIEYYQKAILYDPNFPDPYYNLASVYGYKGNYKEAIKNYNKYLEFNPDENMKKMTSDRINYCMKMLKNENKTSQSSNNKENN